MEKKQNLKIFYYNLIGLVFWMKFLSLILKQEGGFEINISSVLGKFHLIRNQVMKLIHDAIIQIIPAWVKVLKAI